MCMLNVNALNVNGSSRIDGRDVAYFNASFTLGPGMGGNYTVSKSVSDKEVYEANKAQCGADYASFEASVNEIISRVGQSGAAGALQA